MYYRLAQVVLTICQMVTKGLLMLFAVPMVRVSPQGHLTICSPYVLVCRTPRYGNSHSINGCQVFQEHHQSQFGPIYHREQLELRIEFGLN